VCRKNNHRNESGKNIFLDFLQNSSICSDRYLLSLQKGPLQTGIAPDFKTATVRPEFAEGRFLSCARHFLDNSFKVSSGQVDT